MNKEIKARTVVQNLAISVAAQAVSLLVSLVLSMIVPKFIPEIDYSYWQTYVLYAGYVGIFHFGLLDGMVLRYSQLDYQELNRPQMKRQFNCLLAWTVMISCLVSAVSLCFLNGVARKLVILVAISIVLKNIFTYCSYLLQITNRIPQYAVQTIAQRVTYGLIALGLILIKQGDFTRFCLADLCGDAVGFAVGAIYSRKILFGRFGREEAGVRGELKKNISAGIWLLVANLSAVLFTEGARMVIQWRFDALSFGKISFAFSAANLVLSFITALSIAFFPSLKRMKQESLSAVYSDVSQALTAFLSLALLCYFPGCAVLKMWIPKYEGSLYYMGLMLPMVLFSAETMLLSNNYLKTFRKEKQLFLINLISVMAAMALYIFAGYVLNKLEAVVLSIVIMIAVRSVILDVTVLKMMHLPVLRRIIEPIILTLVFEAAVIYCSAVTGFILYGLTLTVYLWLHRKNIVSIVKIRKNAAFVMLKDRNE